MVHTSLKHNTTAWRHLWRRGLLGTALAVGANALIYLLARRFGWVPQDVLITGLSGPVMLFHVASSTLFAGLGATLLFALLSRFVRRSVRAFGLIAGGVLLLSFFTPFSLPGAPPVMIATLELMHLTAALILVGALTWARGTRA